MKRHVWLGLLAAALVCGGLASSSWAEDSPPAGFKTYDLGDLVVSADRPDSRQVTTSQEMSEEEIKATNSKTAAEALSHAPGIVVNAGHRNEQLVQIYGLAQEKALILIDGVPYYETKYRRLNLDQIPADIISKIEIIKGAPSVLYGANALAGVINIITKKAGDKPVFEAVGEVSENQTYHYGLSQGMKVDKVNYWFNYSHRETDGWRISDDFRARPGAIVYKPGKTVTTVLEDGGYRNNSDSKVDTIWTRLGWEPTDKGEYFVNLSWLSAERGMPPNINSEQVFTTRPAFAQLSRWGKYDDLGFDLSGKQQIGERLTLKGKLFYHDHQDDYVSYNDLSYSKVTAVSTYHDYFVGGNLVVDYLMAEGHNLGAALHYKGDSHKERDDVYLPFAETFSYTGSAAGEYRFTGLPGLMLVGGASYDWYQIDHAQSNVTDASGNLLRQRDLGTPEVKAQLNPMAGASYTFSDTTRLFGSVARKTRFPTLMELYSSKGGNINLEAEKSVNYTLGVGRKFGKDVEAQVSGFYMDINDWISRDGPNVTSQYQNYANIKIAGAEAGASWRPVKDLVLRLDYTYSQARDDSPGRVTDKVLGVPDHKLGLGASYLFPVILTKLDLRGELIGQHYDQLPTPQNPKQQELNTGAFCLLNAKVSRVFWEHYEGYFAVNNIFEKYYEQQVYYPGQGRAFWLGLALHF
jgi:iron complex outermembrane receptor protein